VAPTATGAAKLVHVVATDTDVPALHPRAGAHETFALAPQTVPEAGPQAHAPHVAGVAKRFSYVSVAVAYAAGHGERPARYSAYPVHPATAGAHV
jgi:hypothetical protein